MISAGNRVCLTNLSSAMREVSATSTISTPCWMRPRSSGSSSDIFFLIVGNGVAKAELEKKAAKLNLANVRFMPFQPRENLPWMRASSDVQVSLYRNGAANDSFSSKIYEIMASGRPLLAAAEPDSEVARAVASAGCGLCISPGDAERLAESILTLYEDAALREQMGQQGRRYAEAHHSKHAAVTRYDELLRSIGSKGQRGKG